MSAWDDRNAGGPISRRGFLKAGAWATCVGGLAGCAGQEARPTPAGDPAPQPAKARVTARRRLGRTGFEVSDIGMGCGSIAEPNVVRYAYDQGINLFDTAEGYENGASESKIGQAMTHLERSKIFLITKLKPQPGETEQSLLDRFAACLDRLKTSYVDALYIHGVSRKAELGHPGFQAAAARLRADGKIRHLGVSCHGPRGKEGDSLEQVLLAAAEDGRFDLMLLVYNFMNHEPGARVLAACRQKDLGAIVMKATAGQIKVEPFDPQQPTGEYADSLERMLERGLTREQAIERIQAWVAEQEAALEPTRTFNSQHAITSEAELHQKSVQWVLANPDAHSVIPSLKDFDQIDRFAPISGTRLSVGDKNRLEAWAQANQSRYCRHGCSACAASCPHDLPISTILRYRVYFENQGREKQAMRQYSRLAGRDAGLCSSCPAPCRGACPHQVPIQASLVRAHDLLSLA